MKILRVISILFFCISAFLVYRGIKTAKSSVLNNIRVQGEVVGTVISNYYNPSAEYEPIFENDEVTIIKEGSSQINFITENGINCTSSFLYSFSRLPDDKSVTLVYDKTNPMRFTVKGFDSPDISSAVFTFAFALLTSLPGIFTGIAAIILGIVEKMSRKKTVNTAQEYEL